jgi:hypothetical protein
MNRGSPSSAFCLATVLSSAFSRDARKTWACLLILRLVALRHLSRGIIEKEGATVAMHEFSETKDY